MKKSLSIKDASQILKISEQRVRTLCRDKILDGEKTSSGWIISESSIMNFTKNNDINNALDHDSRELNTKPKGSIALSFFSGAMGLDLGLEKAGFDIRLACEVDKFCRQTIVKNRPNTALISDLNDYSAEDVLRAANLTHEDEIDLIVGGPPCQAFSTAGKRQGLNDDRGNVFLKYLEVATTLRPKFIVIENVRGLLSCPMEHRPHEQRGADYPDLTEDELKGGALNFILNRIEHAGYSYSFNLYNAANFGTPQIRERVVIICSRDGISPPYLEPTHSENGQHGLPKWNNIRDCFDGITTHTHLSFPEKRLKYYRMLGPGQNWKNLPLEFQMEAMGKSFYSGGGKTGFLRRLSWLKPSPTLVTHPAMPATDLAHPEEDRPLSIEEYKRIQQFPDDWFLAGPLVQQYKQVGNAVPLGLGYAIGRLIMKLLSNQPVTQLANFEYSRYKNTSHIDWKAMFYKQLSDSKKTTQNLLF